MYAERLNTLVKMYKVAERSNKAFEDANRSIATLRGQQLYVTGLSQAIAVLERVISLQEKAWQDRVLRELEAEIIEELSYVYPTDGYTVSLTSRILRGKIHIEGFVRSNFADTMAGDISDTQGRLFQQIVSFSALIGIMKILGVNTVYIDEAFSGSSTQNIEKVNQLLRVLQTRGFNIILISQNMAIANGLDANVLLLNRSLDNKTNVTVKGD